MRSPFAGFSLLHIYFFCFFFCVIEIVFICLFSCCAAQDSLLAVSKFTRRDTFLTRPMVFDLLLQIPYWDGIVPPPAILCPEPLWTGKQLFSLLLCFNTSTGGGGANTRMRINMMRDVGGLVDRKKENLFISERDERVIIRQGELLAGKICKKTVGSSSGSLIHLLWNEAGPERTKDFLGALQKLVNFWLLHQGFTVGCSDIITSPETCRKVEEILKEAKEEVAHLTKLAHQGRLEAQPGKSLRESFEARVNKELNAAREKSGKVASEQLDESNNIMAMVRLSFLLSPFANSLLLSFSLLSLQMHLRCALICCCCCCCCWDIQASFLVIAVVFVVSSFNCYIWGLFCVHVYAIFCFFLVISL